MDSIQNFGVTSADHVLEILTHHSFPVSSEQAEELALLAATFLEACVSDSLN